jgi:hypothetical protein
LQILKFIECLTSKVTGAALVARPPVTSDFAVPGFIKSLPSNTFLMHTVYMYCTNQSAKLRKPALMSKRLVDQLRERIRYMHYSLRSVGAYVYRVRFFVRQYSARIGLSAAASLLILRP